MAKIIHSTCTSDGVAAPTQLESQAQAVVVSKALARLRGWVIIIVTGGII